MTTPHPGVSEVGWLADLKQMAEQVGSLVFGEAIRWDVEVIRRAGARRPDVIIRRERDGAIIASGEAKRPDTPAGAHPLVASEVRDAREKAAILRAPVFFTTNFFEAAVFDGDILKSVPDLERLQGNLLSVVPESLATAPNWWVSSSAADRNAQVLLGLRHLLERIKAAQGGGLGRDINEVALFVFSRVTDRLVQPLYEALLHDRGLGLLDRAINRHALRVHLVIQHDEELRFLAAQGVAEVLTAVLFYRNIADHFALSPLLGGTIPRTASVLLTRITRSLTQATVASGDYEPILELSPIARFVLERGGESGLAHWKDLIAFVDQLDFTTVTSDVIGTIFERLISPERRYAMGQHYTNSRLARSMSRWALRSPTDIIADISCGAGTFLVELHRLMANSGRSHKQILAQLLGNDMDPFAVHLAAINLVTRDIYRGANYPAVRLGDAFDIEPGVSVVDVQPANGERVLIEWPSQGLQAVVGNPPYAEKPDDIDRLKMRIARLGYMPPTGMQGGNLAAWFYVLAAALVSVRGVIALVMPSGVLQNSNLEVWRSWLRAHFDLTVWHCEDDVWFSDARVATCVILATPQSNAESPGRLNFVNVQERVDGQLVFIDDVPSPVANAKVRNISHIDVGADILVAGACPDLLHQFSRSDRIHRIKDCDWMKVYSGNKLGHSFFQLRDLEPMRKKVIRRVSGLKLESELNKTYLRPLLSSPKDERTGEFRGSEYWVLSAPEKLPASGQLRTYIDSARKLGVHRAPSVAQRGTNWWKVNWRESQIAVQIHPGFLHQVWWSPEPFVAKNNFHVFTFAENVSQMDRELVAASLASG